VQAAEAGGVMMPSRVEQIVPDLRRLAVPIGDLVPLPGNPRLGDVEAVKRSYVMFGQRKPVVARRSGPTAKSGTVIAGNHQLAAAIELGWTHLAVVWTDDDEATAQAFALADNRTSELGGYDDRALLGMLTAVQRADAALFEATAYQGKDLARLLERLTPPDAAPQEIPETYEILVACGSESNQRRLLERLTEEGLVCRALLS
jgi:ParB-like chromosome segregation protein Spo0J